MSCLVRQLYDMSMCNDVIWSLVLSLCHILCNNLSVCGHVDWSAFHFYFLHFIIISCMMIKRYFGWSCFYHKFVSCVVICRHSVMLVGLWFLSWVFILCDSVVCRGYLFVLVDWAIPFIVLWTITDVIRISIIYSIVNNSNFEQMLFMWLLHH